MTEKNAPSKRRMAVRPLPLGIAKQTPMAVVTYAEIDPLIEPLGLADEVRLKLCATIRGIMARYLGQKLSAEDHEDHAASLKALRSIEKNASALAKQLDMIEPDMLVALDKLRAKVSDLRQQSRSYFEFLPLADQLYDLARVAAFAESKIKPNARKRPVRVNLDQAIDALCDAIHEATGKAPRRSRSKGSIATRRLVGKEGAFLLSLFKHFDPSVSERMLFGIIDKQKAKKAPKTG